MLLLITISIFKLALLGLFVVGIVIIAIQGE